LLNFHAVYLLIFGVFLFDSLGIILYGKGILNIDFSDFFNLSNTPFFLLFLVSFGIITTSLSVLVNLLFSNIFNCVADKLESCINKMLGLKSKPKINENSITVSFLYKIALTAKDAFLLEYVEKEIKNIHNMKKNYRVVYSLTIAVILNWLVTLLYDKKTIFDFIIFSYKNNGFSFINICLTLLIAPVILTIISGLKHSVAFDDEKIYFPEVKYNLLKKK